MSIMRSVFLLSLAASSAVAAPLLSKRNGAMTMNGAMVPVTSEAAEFGYEGNSGPNFWPDECQKTDPGQSPIDLREGSADLETGSLEADLPAQENCVLTNSGHDLRVALDPAAPKMSFVPAGQSDTFEVEGFHFHSPSEHHVNGKYFDAEMHMVGKSANGGTAVLAVFFEVSATPQEGNLISLMAENFPLDGREATLPAVDFTTILEATNELTSFYSYTGSLTTPPCTTGVLWSVMETPVPISVRDVLAMRKELVFSARFTQVARDEEPVFTPPKKEGEAGEAPCDAGDVDVPAEEPVAEEFPVEPAVEEPPCDTAPEAPAEEIPIAPAEEIPVEPEQPCETPEPETPIEPVAEEIPVEPAVEEPEQPCETPEPEAPIEPVAEVPVEPAVEEPEQPCETPEPEAPIEPVAEVPVEPAVEEPEQPCETPEPEAPVEPVAEVPVEPEQPCETPEPEAPVEPVAEDPVEPEQPCETPEPEAPVEPVAEDPVEPEQPCETPEPEAPVEPVAEVPVEPEQPCETPEPEVPPPVEPAAEEPCETPASEPAKEEEKKEEWKPAPTY